MVEIGSVKTMNNSDLLLKSSIVIAVSSITFFIVGFGFAMQSDGGIFGQQHFLGLNLSMLDYSDWIYYWSLCVTMAQIATGPIAERTSLETYFFFSFLTSALVFPMGIAITW
jgi:ammonium transporter, Amt family